MIPVLKSRGLCRRLALAPVCLERIPSSLSSRMESACVRLLTFCANTVHLALATRDISSLNPLSPSFQLSASPRFLQSGGRPAFSSLELGDHGYRHMAEVTERELTARAMSHRVLVDGHPANEPQLCCSHGTAGMGPALARTRSNVTVIKGAVLSVPES
ncbi:hypothetical protein CMUS01_15921 [Colletotrichum musicola]|uniref:Uncharacterized protein n=1 Tax=Colletotrichum musicola TaxID=2175873 RepID=A0A8H6MKK7_9PEZI|nr:hypothetical protein CMUS01_15921 [Colletotrichum musicola]